jgi:hypothetical protein
MSSYPPPGNPYQPAPMQPPRQGIGCGVKILIALGICFVVLVLICAGVIGYGVYYAKHAIVQDPAKVEAMTADMTRIDVPPPLKPTMGMTLNVPFSSKTVATAVFYADPPSHSVLMLMAAGDAFEGKDQAQMQQSFEQSFRQQGARGEGEQTIVQQTRQENLTIRGQKATFTIGTGVGSQSKKPRIQVQGSFQGNKGTVALMLDADASKISEEKAEQMLKSIR